MRKSAITALAVATGAGIAYLLGTRRGQEMVQQAKQAISEVPDRINQARTSRMVDKALKQPHPDTAMAHAFEEAGAL